LSTHQEPATSWSFVGEDRGVSSKSASKSAPEPASQSTGQFLDLIAASLSDGSFRRLVVAKPKGGAGCQRVTFRPIALKDQPMVSVVQHFATNDITKNVERHGAMAAIAPLVNDAFLRGHLTTATAQIDMLVSKKGKVAIHRGKLQTGVQPLDEGETAVAGQPPQLREVAADLSHDRIKKRFIPQDRPYLAEVGITDRNHRVVPAMARKWKQINKFVEIVDGAIKSGALAEATDVTVIDFGAGKGYLTFALHDHLVHTLNKQASVQGVEIREELVDAANLAAQHTATENGNSAGLQFVCGDIEHADVTAAQVDILVAQVDILVALHACDTATDAAIFRGIQLGAEVIICSPCCHKELRPQMTLPEPLAPLLSFGVHLGQEADMVTDTLRALILEQHGYDTKVFEFIGLEETSKNKMILAVRRGSSGQSGHSAQATASIAALKTFYGITSQHLEQLLMASPSSAPLASESLENQ
jgi:Methyltransferase domain